MELRINDGSLELNCSHCKNPIQKGEIIYHLRNSTYDSPYCAGQGITTEAMGLRGEMEDVLESGDKYVAVEDSITIEDSDFEIWNRKSPIMIVLRVDRYPYNAGEIIKAKSLEQVNDMLVITTFSGSKVSIERSLVDIYF